MQSPSRQRGMGLFKMIFAFGPLIILGMAAFKSFPIYSNHFKIAKSVSNVAKEGITDPHQVKKALERRWTIEDITLLEPKDIKVERGDRGKVALAYEYEAVVPLFYNIQLLFTFNGREPISGNE